MQLQDYRDTFYIFSGKASDLNRQLGFAAIAIIWLFKTDATGQPAIPPSLIWPGILVVASLSLDMLHYCVASVIWRCFYRSKEKARVRETTDIKHSEWLEYPIWTLFVLKIACVVIAYFYIGLFLVEKLLIAKP